VAERIRESVSELETATARGSFQVTLSLGLAAYDPENPKPWPGLMEEADQHLYQAKAQGRNCVRWPATEVAER
jgi:diguanylate cyclase (GGDEF)-like protein